MNNQRPLWPHYLLGGLGIVLMVIDAVEAALAVWQRVFLFAVLFMVLSSFGWFLYKWAEFSATGIDSTSQ